MALLTRPLSVERSLVFTETKLGDFDLVNDIRWLKSPGESIGEFVVVAPIGKGGMGEIYLCRDLRLNRNVAVKLVADPGTQVYDARERLLREARLLAQAHHPNIATIFAIGSDDLGESSQSVPFIAMEHIQGESLYSLIQSCRLNLPEVLQIMIEIGSALQVAHDEGILHRDIKPSNILFDRYGFSKLIDFGVASGRTVLQRDGKENIVEGTLNYMAPEILEGMSPSVHTDIYALGLVLCEMLTAQIPFLCETQAQTIGEIKSGFKLTDLDIQLLPTELVAIISSATASTPDARFRSAADFVAAVRRIDLSSYREVYLRPLRGVPRSIIEGSLTRLQQSGLHRCEWPFVISRALDIWNYNYSDGQFSTTLMEEFLPDDVLRASIGSVVQRKAERRNQEKRGRDVATSSASALGGDGRSAGIRLIQPRPNSTRSAVSAVSQSGPSKSDNESEVVVKSSQIWVQMALVVASVVFGFLLGVLVERIDAIEHPGKRLRLPAGFQEFFRNQK
jgi:serine/threonine protein kinase